ncbi:MAG: hypothetical protein ACF8OB_07450 [Phycisphaeraceae bacterium JB051]
MFTFFCILFGSMIAAAVIVGTHMYQNSDELRPQRLLRKAEAKGYGFEENGSSHLKQWNNRTPLFLAGENRSIHNVVYAPYRDVDFAIFDYRFMHGEHTYNTSVLAFELTDKNMPRFSLWPRVMMPQHPVLEHEHDCVPLNLDGNNHASQMQNLYSLHTANEGSARLLFCPKAVEYLAAHPDFFVEGYGNRIILYQINKRRQPGSLEGMLHNGYQVLRAMRLNDPRVNFEPDLDEDVVEASNASAISTHH